jgi:hypothetical protein
LDCPDKENLLTVRLRRMEGPGSPNG